MPADGTKGKNAFGVSNIPIDYSPEHAITTKIYHGAVIQVNDNIVGRIQSWTPTPYSREVSTVREINKDTYGRGVDIVPGIVADHNIAMTRTEVWDEEVELAMGFDDIFWDLGDQNRPFSIDEVLHQGDTVYRAWKYVGCWFTERNESA